MDNSRLKSEEKFMNFILFCTNVMVPIVAYTFVMLFLNGNRKDAIVLLMVIAAVITKLLERKLGKYAKFVYANIIPFFGAILIAFANDGHYGAMSHGFFMVTILVIPYYNYTLLGINVAVTLVINMVCFVFFPKGYLNMHSIAVWVFICAVYLVVVLICVLIIQRAKKIFSELGQKEIAAKQVLNGVEKSFEKIHRASENINQSLYSFQYSTQEIAESTQHIAGNAQM